jgi:hypothetical protein
MLNVIIAWLWGWGGVGTLMTAGAIVVAITLPGFRRLAIEAAIVCAAATACYTNGVRVGSEAAFESIATQNKEAVDAVNKVRSRVRSCHDSGGVWSQAARECQPGR